MSRGAIMAEPRIRIFLDNKPEPVTDYRPPAEVALDTGPLPDGEHQLRIEAVDTSGNVGVRTVPFVVRNGPGITLSGLREGGVVHGVVRLRVNAFGAEEPFEPHRAESRTPTPVWIWVLSLIVVAWSGWYVATMWAPPSELSKTPTFASAVMWNMR